MPPDKSIRQLIAILLMLTWVSSAVALAVAVPKDAPDMTTFPIIHVALSVLVTLTGALSRTSQRAIDRNRDPEFSILRELRRDVLTSIAIAIMIYSYAAMEAWSMWRLSVALVIGGYGGIFVLDLALKWLKKRTFIDTTRGP